MAAQFAQACESRYEQSLQLILAPCREALELLLPYDTHWDKRSWWYSQYCVIMLCAAFLNQHRLQINAVRALNTETGQQGGGCSTELL